MKPHLTSRGFDGGAVRAPSVVPCFLTLLGGGAPTRAVPYQIVFTDADFRAVDGSLGEFMQVIRIQPQFFKDAVDAVRAFFESRADEGHARILSPLRRFLDVQQLVEGRFGVRATTKHSAFECVRRGTGVHSNTIEGVFSLLKRGVMAYQVAMRPKQASAPLGFG